MHCYNTLTITNHDEREKIDYQFRNAINVMKDLCESFQQKINGQGGKVGIAIL